MKALMESHQIADEDERSHFPSPRRSISGRRVLWLSLACCIQVSSHILSKLTRTLTSYLYLLAWSPTSKAWTLSFTIRCLPGGTVTSFPRPQFIQEILRALAVYIVRRPGKLLPAIWLCFH